MSRWISLDELQRQLDTMSESDRACFFGGTLGDLRSNTDGHVHRRLVCWNCDRMTSECWCLGEKPEEKTLCDSCKSHRSQTESRS